MTDKLALFAATFAALYAAHQVADHWIQTEYQAATKGVPGWRGRWACARHVATYTITCAVALGALVAVLDARMSLPWAACGLAVSAVTHYVADRRGPLRAMAIAAGHRPFHGLGTPRPGRDDNPSLGTGAYALDQSWHYLWLFIASLMIAWP
jgi:hypothetical protein